MADVKELKALVTKENEMFVKHFKTDSAPRNLVRGIPKHGKLLEGIVDDKIAQATMMVEDAIIICVTEGFKKYLARKAEMDSKGEKKQMPDRIVMFRDMVDEEIKGLDDEKSSAIENAITTAMKNSDAVSKASEADVDQDVIHQVLLYAGIRGVMCSVIPEEKKDDSDASGHKAEPPKADGADDGNDQIGSTGDDGEPAGTAGTDDGNGGQPTGTNDGNNQQPNGPDVVVDEKKVEELEGKFREMLSNALALKHTDVEGLCKARTEMQKFIAGFDKVIIEELNLEQAPVDVNGTGAFASNLLKASIPATHVDELGDVKIDAALNIATEIIIDGCSGCADTASSNQISTAVTTGAFMMYSLLASQLDDCKNINWLLLSMGGKVITKKQAMDKDFDSVSAFKTLFKLCQFELLNQYKARVDVAIFKDTGNIADQGLADFGRNLCAAEFGRHIRRGIEICKVA